MDQLKAFLEKAGTDEGLNAKLEALGEESGQNDAGFANKKLIALAAEHGFTFTLEDVEAAKTGTFAGELSEEQLEHVSGGEVTFNRYCSSWCKNLTEDRWACKNPLWWCDHFRRDLERVVSKYTKFYWYSCSMGAYPRFLKEEHESPNDGVDG